MPTTSKQAVSNVCVKCGVAMFENVTDRFFPSLPLSLPPCQGGVASGVTHQQHTHFQVCPPPLHPCSPFLSSHPSSIAPSLPQHASQNGPRFPVKATFSLLPSHAPFPSPSLPITLSPFILLPPSLPHAPSHCTFACVTRGCIISQWDVLLRECRRCSFSETPFLLLFYGT